MQKRMKSTRCKTVAIGLGLPAVRSNVAQVCGVADNSEC